MSNLSITVRLNEKADADLLAFFDTLSPRQRSKYIRDVLHNSLQNKGIVVHLPPKAPNNVLQPPKNVVQQADPDEIIYTPAEDVP